MSKRIITINRMYGSNGRIIGKALAEEMGIGFYDRELIELASSKKQIPLSQFAEVDEKRPSPWGFPIDSELQIGVDVDLGDTQGDYNACQKAGVPFLFAAYGFGRVDAKVPQVESLEQLPEVMKYL